MDVYTHIIHNQFWVRKRRFKGNIVRFAYYIRLSDLVDGRVGYLLSAMYLLAQPNAA